MHQYGLTYKETNPGSFPVDPWTTCSHIFLLVVIVYWAFKVLPAIREHSFMAFSLVLISMNFIGSFVYHSARGPLIWVLLDSVPIGLLTVAITAHYLRRIFGAWYTTLAVIALPFILIFFSYSLFKLSAEDRPNLGYFAVGIPLVFTMAAYLGITHWRNWQLMAGAIVFVMIAIFFRIIDNKYSLPFLYMGTHWLWHIFSTISAHLLLTYMYLDDLHIKKKQEIFLQTGTYRDAG